MSTVRLRRLAADFAKLKEYARRHPRVRLVQADGDPPERYQIEYRIRSLRMVGGELQPVASHLVEVTLPRNYPRTPPQCRMLSPVFHPNIAPHAICVGDHWSAGESLQSIITRIGEMLAYQSYNVKSPLNGEAARWVEENKDRVPLDPVSLLVDEQREGDADGAAGTLSSPQNNTPQVPRAQSSPRPMAPPDATPHSAIASPQAASVADSASAGPMENSPLPTHAVAVCPLCRARYRVPVKFLGHRVRCKSCNETFVCVAPASGESTD